MAEFAWLNEPPSWSSEGSGLELETGDTTDFWRHTHYGFVRDTGHAWLTPVAGDFTASAGFTGAYSALYDQAGLMLRVDEAHWIKAGIEFTDGLMHFSTVVTAGVSDWSVIPLPDTPPDTQICVRLSRHGDAVRVEYAVGGGTWRMARLCPFAPSPARIGPMACSPTRSGFSAAFRDISIGAAISRNLHGD